MEDYKIELGVKLNTSDLAEQIAKVDDKHKVKIGVNLGVDDIKKRISKYNENANNAKLHLKIKLDTDDLNKQIKALNLGGVGGGKGVAIPVNTKSLEDSLGEVKTIIESIHKSLGALDDGKGMKPLLTSVNQIADALGKATNESETLVKSLNVLASKDFGINLGVKLGGANKNPIANNAAYGNYVRGSAIPQLQKQANALMKAIRDEYAKRYSSEYFDFQSDDFILEKLSNRNFYTPVKSIGLLQRELLDDKNLSKQMSSYSEYISVIEDIAKASNIDLSGVTSGFSRTKEEIIQGALDIQGGVKNAVEETEEQVEKLKGVLNGGSIDSEGLGKVLEPIITDLGEIKKAFQEFSNIKPFEGLTLSLEKLDGTLDKLLSNVNAVKKVVDAGLSIASPTDDSNSGTEKAIQDQKELAQESKETAEAVNQAFNKISVENVAQEFKEVDIAIGTTESRIERLSDALKDVGFNDKAIEDITKDFQNLLVSVQNVTSRLNNDGSIILTVKGIDQYERAVKVMKSVTLDKETDEWKVKDLGGTVSQDFKEASNFIKQQKRAVADLTNQINQLNRAAKDQNASRPIKGNEHLATLQTKYDEITAAIQKMGATSSDTFVDAQNDVKRLISEFKSLVSEFKNAENVALQMDGNDFESGKKIASNNLGKLKEQAKDFEKMQATITNLSAKFDSVGDVSSLKEFNNELRVARSELAKVKAEAIASNKAQENADFNKLKSLSERIKHLNFQIDTTEDAAEIKNLVNQLNALESEYNELYAVTSKKLSSDQIAELNPIENLNREMANFVKLQEEISRKTINIKQLETQGADADYIATLKRQLEELENTYNRLMKAFRQKLSINADIVTMDDIARYDDQVNAVAQGLKHELGKIDANTIKSINKEMVEFVKLRKQINDKQSKINALEYEGGNQNYIAELNRQLEELENTYARLMHTFMKKLTANADILPMDDIKNFDSEIQNTENVLRELDAKIADTKSKLASDIKLDFGTFETEVLSLENNIGKLSSKSADLVTGIELLKKHLASMKSASTDDELIASAEKYKQTLKEVENQLKQNQIAEQKANDAARLKQEKEKFSLQMGNWLKDNSAAAKDFGGRIRELQAQIDACDSKQLNGLKREFQIIKQEAKEAGKTTQTLGDSLKAQFAKYSSYLSIASLYMYAEQALRSMFEQIKLIDSAMTELKKVTNETDATYNKFLSNAAKRSKELGTTIDGLVSSTADFARLGYGFKDAQGLAEVANIYAVVGDEINGVEGATESLISTLAAFKDKTSEISDSDFAMDIVDKFNEVSNNFAISSGGIGEAMQRSASSLRAANNTIDESIALITAANTVVQDPEQVGKGYAD